MSSFHGKKANCIFKGKRRKKKSGSSSHQHGRRKQWFELTLGGEKLQEPLPRPRVQPQSEESGA